MTLLHNITILTEIEHGLGIGMVEVDSRAKGVCSFFIADGMKRASYCDQDRQSDTHTVDRHKNWKEGGVWPRTLGRTNVLT